MKSNQEEIKGGGRLAGIVRAAKALGVTRQHLRLVLRGERVSPRLLYSVGRRFPHLVIERVK